MRMGILVSLLIDWLIVWLTDWGFNWLIYWLTDPPFPEDSVRQAVASVTDARMDTTKEMFALKNEATAQLRPTKWAEPNVYQTLDRLVAQRQELHGKQNVHVGFGIL